MKNHSILIVMKKHIVLTGIISFFLITSLSLTAQVSISTDNSSADNSAMLDVKSTSKGVVLPRMTQAQISAIANPANGLLVFCTTDNKFYTFLSSVNAWKEIQYGSGIIAVNSGSFICGNLLSDSRDGKTYATVQIGSQCWMKENLNYGTRITGTTSQTNNGIHEKYCFNDLDSYCTLYGGLYQWGEMMNYTSASSDSPSGRQGICPAGWHIPSNDEWCTLEAYLEPPGNCAQTSWTGTSIGGMLKETGTTHWNSPNTGATNASGFTAISSGTRGASGSFYNFGVACTIWTTSIYTPIPSLYWYRDIFNSHSDIFHGANDPSLGFSVRCVKD